MLSNGHRNSVKPWPGHRGLNGLHVVYSESEEEDYSDDAPVYENVAEDEDAVYENVAASATSPAGRDRDRDRDRLHLPVLRTDTGVYENLDFDESDDGAVYENVNECPTYDVPQPQRRPLVVDTGRPNQHYMNLSPGPIIPAPGKRNQNLPFAGKMPPFECRYTVK